MPFSDPQESCRIIFDNFKKIPFWPQLPKRSYLENMYVQFSERLPGLVVDEPGKNIFIDNSRVASEIESVYAKYLEGDTEFFKISEDHAAGFYKFIDGVGAGSKEIKAIKGHITGPISFALSVTDQNKRAVIYDKDLFEVLTKTLVMKVRWQIKRLKKAFPSVIIFIDEPYLVSIGSSYVNINTAAAFEKLDELIKSVRQEGALCGIHCCGNTDWGAVLKRDIDILSFDAYNFTKELLLYAPDVKNYLDRGGSIAWGIVPSSEGIEKETLKGLTQRFKSTLSGLSEKGIPKGSVSSLITPSCGVGTLTKENAKKALEITNMLSEEMR
jgi:methionine synthase II (cobalamin-independent)